jgi:hypothetical protein
LCYEFSPDENHYGGKPERMLAAELVNIDKIVALANLDEEAAKSRKRQCRLGYLPDLIAARKLQDARRQLKELGFNRKTAKYWVAFLPESALNLRRAILKLSRKLFKLAQD